MPAPQDMRGTPRSSRNPPPHSRRAAPLRNNPMSHWQQDVLSPVVGGSSLPSAPQPPPVTSPAADSLVIYHTRNTPGAWSTHISPHSARWLP